MPNLKPTLYGLDQEEIKKLIADLNAGDFKDTPVVTEVKPLEKFYEAEKYHHQYFKNNPDKAYCQLVIDPKVLKFKKKFAHLLKK